MKEGVHLIYITKIYGILSPFVQAPLAAKIFYEDYEGRSWTKRFTIFKTLSKWGGIYALSLRAEYNAPKNSLDQLEYAISSN